MPPPVHPARTNITESREKDKEEKAAPPQKGFNKSENRKSIRHLAQDWKRRTLRQSKPPAVPAHPQDPPARDVEKTAMPAASSSSSSSSAAALAKIEESKKPDRRKSSSMWGHRLQEITPSKMQMGQVQPTIPESPSGEDKSRTSVLVWLDPGLTDFSDAHLGQGQVDRQGIVRPGVYRSQCLNRRDDGCETGRAACYGTRPDRPAPARHGRGLEIRDRSAQGPVPSKHCAVSR